MGSVEEAANGFRAVRAMGAIALVALLALGFCASMARAESLSMKFTEARANVGIQLDDEALFWAPDTAPFAAQIDPGTGSITAGVLNVPDFATFITEPIDAFVTVEFEIGVIGGSFDQATGALTLSGTAGGTLTSEGKECAVSTTPAVLTLTTSGTSGGESPRSGTPFTSGLAEAGAIAGQWTDMHATPLAPENTTFCNNVDNRIGGAGGVWLEHDSVPPGRVAAGGFHTCAIKADDAPVCWGSNSNGQGSVPAGIGKVDQIAAGYAHNCAIKTDGTPVCWGLDDEGQATVPAGVGTVRQIAAGGRHTCAVETDGTPVCWGLDDEGQATIPPGIGTVRQISAGEAHTCAVETGGTPICWGLDDVGQATLPPGIGTVRQIDAGGAHTCAVKTDGTPVCWGADDIGQATVPAGIGTVDQIAAGGLHTCAVKTDGIPVCWGRNAPNGPQPTLPPGIGTVTQITAGDWHSCAIKADDTLVCWGSHIYNQLGGPPIITSGPPPSLVGVGSFSHTYTLAPPPGGSGGETLAVRFFLSSGSLPPGLTLDETTGTLTGTPTADGAYTGVVSATNDVFSSATQAFSITIDTTAPAAPSGLASTPASPSPDLKPRIAGTAEAGSTVRLYDNDTCSGSPRATGSAGIFASPGLQIIVAAGSTTTVYATSTDAAGNTSACSTSKATYDNAEDPDPTDPGPGDGGEPQPAPKPRACVVPKLAGKTLARAKTALKAAGCKLGEVHKPKQPKGKKRRVLVVKSSSPRRGAKPADRTVDLKLQPKPKPRKTRG
jgi:hypothetical protein